MRIQLTIQYNTPYTTRTTSMQYQENSHITADVEFVVSLLYLITHRKERRILDVFSATKYSILDGIPVSCEDCLLTFITNENGTIKLQNCEYILQNRGKYYIVPCSYDANDLEKNKVDKEEKKINILIKTSKIKETKPDAFITLHKGVLIVPCKLEFIRAGLKETSKYPSKFTTTISKDQVCKIEAYLAYRVLYYKQKKQLPRGIEKFAFVYCIYNHVIPSSTILQSLITNVSNTKKWKTEYTCFLERKEWNIKTKEATDMPYDLYTLENCTLIDRLTSGITDSMCAKVSPLQIPIKCVLRKRLQFVDEDFVGVFLSGSALIKPRVDWKNLDTLKKREIQFVLTEEEVLVEKYKDKEEELVYLHNCIGIDKQHQNKKQNIQPLKTPKVSLRWHIETLRKYMLILFNYRIEYITIGTWCDTCNMKIHRSEPHKHIDV